MFRNRQGIEGKNEQLALQIVKHIVKYRGGIMPAQEPASASVEYDRLSRNRADHTREFSDNGGLSHPWVMKE